MAILAAGLWMIRLPLAEMTIRGALAQRGLGASFQLIQLDFSSATLANFAIGDPSRPDLALPLAEASWSWAGVSPRLETLRLVRPSLRLSVNQAGAVSAGALRNIRPGERGGARPVVPRVRLTIEQGEVLIDAPFGPLRAELVASGVIGQDFAALARIAETSHQGAAFALDSGRAEFSATAAGDLLSMRFAARSRAMVWNGARVGPAQIEAAAETPLDLATLTGSAAWRIAAITSEHNSAAGIAGAANTSLTFSETELTPATWQAEARLSLLRGAQREMRLENGELRANLNGANGQGAMTWSVTAANAQGLGVRAAQPIATGEIEFTGPGAFNGAAQLRLTNAALTPNAQQSIRNALPNISGSPIGPTLAQAENAIDRAADRFDLAIPLTLTHTEGVTRIVAAQPIEARAATGARVRVAALRPGAPALAMQWPGSTLTGAAAIDLEGGSVPRATLLFDTIAWAPTTGFDSDGSLSIGDWSANGARIAARELTMSIAAPLGQRGQLDLVGPVIITGPLGDGEVRDMAIDLDLAVQWGQGWRVAPNRSCLPVRMAGMDAAGLSFQGGAFSLCAGPGGAIASADANGRWGDGFIITGLNLNGRMAGEAAQPARLSSSRITGRFSGGGDAIQLNIEAAAPSFSVDMAPDRTIDVVGQSMTALARFGGGAWRVDGAFDLGRLDDPGLPGQVSAIHGNWSATPQDDGVLIRVDAAEAALTARPASAEDERPLFNPMQLSGVNAEMRNGAINAQGALLLNDQARNLASFTARHDIESGAGGAVFTADAIQFGDALQPYEISELARGVVENVRGPAAGVAEITWDKEGVRGAGRVRLDGVSLALATIPVIENVRGEIVFDDLFALTTPPGQNVTVGLVNPGIAVANGRIRFQLLGEQRVAVESAEFDFASGILALEPTTITLGAEEANVRLLLRNVDAANLLATLNIPDLQATGTIEGSFPLRLARNTAFVTDGELYAAPGGGVIQYVGNAGQDATGAARIAFDALRNFDYDNLRITLNGDISGEVVSSIQFTGENSGRSVDISELAPIPGVGRVTARGVPFAFNVNVTAPFRRLAQTAAGFANPRDIISEVVVTPIPPDALPENQGENPNPAANQTPDQ
ncbi:putativeuncharacterized protein ydbH [alpha proteobacterium U9-1i]|nr:putativeuncharacterized protein ydbH [alpha proteobacterium U9-1i]